MFSNALTTSSSAVSNWGPYSSQDVFHKSGNESVFYSTNLFGTSHYPTFMFPYISSSSPSSVTNDVGSWNNELYVITVKNAIIIQTKFTNIFIIKLYSKLVLG
jgi:hypothetical protein